MRSHTIYFPDTAGQVLEGEYLLRFWMRIKVGAEDECWPWQAADNGVGYGQFRYQRRLYLAHRLALADCTGIHGVGAVVLHNCNNPECCNPKHLSYGTQAENIAHAVRCGRMRPPDGKLGGRASAAARKAAQL